MSMKMKGLLKGLRYISAIFDEEEEVEMQIGFPTDVKHVAHIGYDGPSANNPSWIENFKGELGVAGGGAEATNGNQQSAPLESPSRRRSDKPKGSRNKTEGEDQTSAKPSTRRKMPKGGGSSGGQSSSRLSTRSKATSLQYDVSQHSDPGTGHDKTRSVGTALDADQTKTRRRTKSKSTCQGFVLKVSSDQEDPKKSLEDIPREVQAM